MLTFLQDIDKLRPYVATVSAPSRYPHGKDSEDFVISSPAVELDFKKKYKLDYFEVEMLLDGAGESWCITFLPTYQPPINAEQIKALLAQGSQPQFQRLALLHLPPELLSYVLSLIGIRGARLLVATCHVLRELAIPYAFRVGVRVTIRLIRN